MKALKKEELEEKVEQLREEKTRLSEAFVSGRIPEDVYRKTVMKVENNILNITKELKRRSDKE
jgi:predicted Holliday junction resolvase-like endonuclease